MLLKENGYKFLAITKQKPLRYYHVPIFSPGASSLTKAKRVAVPAHGQQRGPDNYTELCAIASFRDNKIFKSILLVLIEAFWFSFSESSNTGTLKQSFSKPSEEERLTWKLCFLQQENKQKASRRARSSVKQLLFFPCSV